MANWLRLGGVALVGVILLWIVLEIVSIVLSVVSWIVTWVVTLLIVGLVLGLGYVFLKRLFGKGGSGSETNYGSTESERIFE